MMDKRKGRRLVYICSRYSGDVTLNTEKAKKYSRYAAGRGVTPIAPHLLFSQFIKEETERDLAMELDLSLLKRCDEVWVFGIENGVSAGMSAEIMSAGDSGQEIRYFTEECKEAYV